MATTIRTKKLTATRSRKLIRYSPKTGKFRWIRKGHGYRKKAGSIWRNSHVVIKVDHRAYQAHRLAWLWMTGRWPRLRIDHINGNGLDNRWINLRLVTHSQNLRNHKRYKNNTSGTTGVFWAKDREKWGVHLAGKIVGYYQLKSEAVCIAKSSRKGWALHRSKK